MYTSLIGCVLLFYALLICKKSALIQYILLTLFFIISGYVLADYRIYSVTNEILDKEVRPANVSGTVERVHLYEHEKIMLTFKDAVIRDVKPLNLINVRVNKFTEMPYAGDKVKTRAGLIPPPGPSMPGDYDYGNQKKIRIKS